MMNDKIDYLLSVACGKHLKPHYCIHIDYQTKNVIRRERCEMMFGKDIGHDVVIEHFTPVVKKRVPKYEDEIEAMIEWEKEHPEIMRMYTKDWKDIDEARKNAKDSGHLLCVDEGVTDVYENMPYYKRGER